jgi:hypothetical protein
MDDEVHPILGNVLEAQEQGERGNYESLLRSYSVARDLVRMNRKTF